MDFRKSWEVTWTFFNTLRHCRWTQETSIKIARCCWKGSNRHFGPAHNSTEARSIFSRNPSTSYISSQSCLFVSFSSLTLTRAAAATPRTSLAFPSPRWYVASPSSSHSSCEQDFYLLLFVVRWMRSSVWPLVMMCRARSSVRLRGPPPVRYVLG